MEQRFIWLTACVAVAILCSQGCATNPGNAAGVVYRFPRTDATVTVSVDISKCDTLTLDASVTIDAVAGTRDDGWVQVPGSALSSYFTARTLKIMVDDNFVISSINSVATDKTAQIVGDVIKIATSFVGVTAKS